MVRAGPAPPLRCPICGVSMVDPNIGQTEQPAADHFSRWISHGQKYHPDYFQWREQWYTRSWYPRVSLAGLLLVGYVLLFFNSLYRRNHSHYSYVHTNSSNDHYSKESCSAIPASLAEQPRSKVRVSGLE